MKCADKCLEGYTFLKGADKICSICDIGYEKVNGTCVKISCSRDRPKFNGVECVFESASCQTGYTSKRTAPLDCSTCDLGYVSENGTCVVRVCPK